MSEDNRKKVNTDTATETAEPSEPFLTRWSRRKALVREGIEPAEPETAEPEPETAPAATAAAAGLEATPPASPEASAGTEAGADAEPGAEGARELPPLESLHEDSDYSAFLAADVAPDLQRQALRKLFHSPKFNLRDGLDDYDLDYTNPALLGDVITAEMRHRIAREVERLAARAGEGPAPDEPEASDEALVAAAAVEDREAEQTDMDAEMEPDTDDDRSDPA